MKSLTKKLLSIFMVLCLTLLSFGFTKVKAATGDLVFTILPNASCVDASDQASTASKTITNGTNSMSYKYEGIKTTSNIKNPFGYGYLMFTKNAGYIYSTSELTGFYVSKISVTFSSTTGTSGKAGGSFDSSVNSKRNTSVSGAVSQNGVFTINNTDQTKKYWNFSTTKSNVQVAKIEITYSLTNTDLKKVSVPTATYDDTTKIVTITSTLNSNGYKLALYANAQDTVSIKEYNFTGATFKIEFPRQGTFVIKLLALGDNTTTINSDYTDVIGTYINDKILPISIADFIKLPVDYNVYYQLTGTIIKIDDNVTGILTIKDLTGEIKVYKMTETQGGAYDSIQNQNLKVGDVITLNGYRSEYSHKAQVGGAYFISKTIDYKESFKSLSTNASLNVSYMTRTEQFEVPANENIKIVSADLGYANGDNVDEIVFSNSTKIICAGGKFYTSDKTIRFYKGSSKAITITSILNLESIVFESKEISVANVTNGTYDEINKTVIPTDKAKDVVIEFGATSKMTAITINTSGEPTIGTKLVYELSKENDGNNKIGLRFGGFVSKELVNELSKLGTSVKFGVVYAKASELGTKTFDAAVVDKTAHVEECAPELVGTDYQFAIVLNHIPATAFDDAVTAACYVEIDGIMYLMQTKTYSVNSIALEYANNHATDVNVKEHLEMLKWLSTYKETITK